MVRAHPDGVAQASGLGGNDFPFEDSDISVH